ncbi:MAG TPA: hypothetical protein VNS46_05665 [Nocardioides sp.]|nr:hypothetical protein [Nocardioides sp.]
MFIGGAELGVSSTEEGSAGTIEVIDASCDPATVELTIDATLGSETYDGDDLEVVGNLNSP